MAKRRRSTRRKSYGRRAKSFLGAGMKSMAFNTVLPAMGYGAAREMVSNWAAPLAQKIPAGAIADEVVLGSVAYLVAKKNFLGLGKVAHAGLIVESARVGEALRRGEVSFSRVTSASPSSGVPIV